MTLRRIRGGSGLGDSIYLRPIVEHFIAAGDRVQVMTHYPDVFLGTKAEVEPFGRNNINVVAHYSWAKSNMLTTQWDDICRNALGRSLPLRFEWKPRNHRLVHALLEEAEGKPIIAVHGGRIPMGRTDGFGKEILPQRDAFLAVMKQLKHCYTVRIGQKNDEVYPIQTDRVLLGTSVSDLFDVAVTCKGIVAQCSFAVPLAEVFDKPLLAVWAAAGLASPVAFVKQITPQKVLSKQTSWYVCDDWSCEKIEEHVHQWSDFAGVARCVS